MSFEDFVCTETHLLLRLQINFAISNFVIFNFVILFFLHLLGTSSRCKSMRTPTDKLIVDEDADLYYDKTKKKEEEYQYQTPYTLYIDFL